MTHDFKERLNWSEEQSDEPFWEEVYKKAFPNMVSLAMCPGDTQSQRLGIDRVVVLSSGRVLKIDEKKRAKVYSDILLEYVSVDRTGALGWIEKDLQIDYLAYAFMPIKRVYLFDWCMLRRAWDHYKDKWMAEYQPKEAQNSTYKTISLPIPIKVLMDAVSTATIIQLETTNG